jgi:hypothetical protein
MRSCKLREEIRENFGLCIEFAVGDAVDDIVLLDEYLLLFYDFVSHSQLLAE